MSDGLEEAIVKAFNAWEAGDYLPHHNLLDAIAQAVREYMLSKEMIEKMQTAAAKRTFPMNDPNHPVLDRMHQRHYITTALKAALGEPNE